MTANPGRHSRAQNLLLFSKLLDGRDNTSPFTLILDSLEQTAGQTLNLLIQRAKATKTHVIYVSYETLRPPSNVTFIPAHPLPPQKVAASIHAALTPTNERHLIIIDTLYSLASTPSFNLAAYLSSLITPHVRLVCVYHTDMPLAPHLQAAHAPSPLTLLRFLATTILTLHSLAHVLDEKAARERSVTAPSFGLAEDVEGVVQGLGSQDARGVVVEMEHRRRSGRSIHATYFCPAAAAGGGKTAADIVLLDDHPLFKAADEDPAGEDEDLGQVSFNLRLTDKQRRDRDGVVLPYYDAQREDAAPGEGGRILYDMGVEDDFDEEEDEI